jgi:hypothetical protein
MAKPNETKDLAVKETGGALVAEFNFSEESLLVLKENLGDDRLSAFDFERIKVPGAGGEFWSIPDISGEAVPSKTLRGIIIYQKPQRAYWASDYTGESTPPDCHSEDCRRGQGNPGGLCAACPYAEWDSDPRGNGGQACKMINTVFLLRPGNILPNLIIVPPTSVQPIRKYFLALSNRSISYWKAVTVLNLKPTKNKGGIPYSVIAPALEAPLPVELADSIASYRDGMQGTFARASTNLDKSDVETE